MEEITQLNSIINKSLIDEIVNIDDNAKRLKLMLKVRINNAFVVTDDETIDRMIVRLIEVVKEYCKSARRQTSCNFFGVCIQRIINMDNKHINQLLRDISVDVLTRLFTGSGGCETKLFTELELDKKIIEFDCKLCGNNKAELIETSFGTYASCLVCSCVERTQTLDILVS
jgi:hypothetical protein